MRKLIISLCLASAPALSHSACGTNQLSGKWDFTSTEPLAVAYCSGVTMDTQGYIKADTGSCLNIDYQKNRASSKMKGGRLRFDASCNLVKPSTIKNQVTGGPVVTFTVTRGQMNPDGKSAILMGEYPDGYPVVVNAIKKP